MKVHIGVNERFPDYDVETKADGDIEISSELYRRYLKASKEYDAVQYKLEKLVEERARLDREATMAAAKAFGQPGSWKRPTTESILAELKEKAK